MFLGKNIYRIVKILFILILSTLCIISICLCMHITMSPDETFSMGLVRYNFLKIIHLDALDVHPPLYYLLLKVFLSITTFYTSSLAIKVIFARILSITFSMIGFLLLYNIGEFIGIKQHYLMSFILFAFIPCNIAIVNTSLATDIGSFTNIRMYSLAFMLVAAEFYEALKADYFNSNIHFILLVIFGSLASYTHNVSAIIAGILIFVFMCYSHRMKNKCKKFFLSGIIFMVLYIPWIPIALKQSRSVYSSDKLPLINASFLMHSGIKLSIICMFITLLSFPVLLSLSYLNDNIKKVVIILGSSVFLTSLIMVLISPKQKLLYLYPIFSIYLYICFSIMKQKFIPNKKSYMFLPMIVSLSVFMFSNLNYIKEYRNSNLYNEVASCRNIHTKSSKLNNVSVNVNNKYSVILLNNIAIYLENNDHTISNIGTNVIKNNLAATQSQKLRCAIYNNPKEKW